MEYYDYNGDVIVYGRIYTLAEKPQNSTLYFTEETVTQYDTRMYRPYVWYVAPKRQRFNKLKW